jgi:hypothetical protein
MRRGWSAIALVVFAGGFLTLVACEAPAATAERTCVPGAYVFCRCEDRSVGTKLCKEDGRSFAKCSCTGASDDRDSEEPPDVSGSKTTKDRPPPEPSRDAGPTGQPSPTSSEPEPKPPGPSCETLHVCCGELRKAKITGSANNCDSIVAKRDEYFCMLANEDYKRPEDNYDPVCF